jgi:glutamate synthase (NADPH/NADH) small chain
MAINKQTNKTPMPEQEPKKRISNFEEVAEGYTIEMALNESARCLDCKHRPCVGGCPVNVQIPDFIKQITQGNFEGAYKTIHQTNSLPAVCGRVCPQESQCEAKCVRGIKGEPVAIGRLERFAADYYMNNSTEEITPPESNGHRVAVIGSGPAGLACAGDLAKLGYDVTVFEAFHTAGGVLVYGIPEFRLPKAIVEREIEILRELGVKIETNMVIGKILSVDELFEQGYEAVFIGSGAGLPSFLGIPGEGLVGVMSANEFLTRINLMKAYRDDYDTPIRRAKRVAVLGGGNVAMDAARSAKRLGSEAVYVVYRRGESEMPARQEEIDHAKEEGIEFRFLTSPVSIHGDKDGQVNAIECVKMDLGEPDQTGRRRPIQIKDSNHMIEVDMVIVAIGNTPNPLIRISTPGLEVNQKGCLMVDENMATSREGVFAGGDAVTGAATVILAMGAGKKAAAAIDDYIQNK